MQSPPVSPSVPRAALVVAHPGHELRVYGWTARERPLVCVLTDGSGSAASSRLGAMSELLTELGAAPGPIYGPWTDRELYETLLAGRYERLEEMARALAAALRAAQVATVAGDAAEGFNPGHDLCRLLINAALARLAAEGGGAIESLEFPLDAAPEQTARAGAISERALAEAGAISERPPVPSAGAMPGRPPSADRRLVLDDSTLARKLAAAGRYAGLKSEVEATLARYGPEAFRVEHLRPARRGFDLAAQHPDPPAYERWGERRVAAGSYPEVLRFRRHMAPAAAHLAAFASGGRA